ncbi:unnamed protein product [Alternaria alternata]
MSSTRHSLEPIDVKEMDATKHVEIAEDFTWTKEEEKKLVRKIDLFLLPTIWLMYLLSYMDRTNIGNAKIAGMADDLQLSSDQYSIALVVFFVTYVVFEPPSNMLLVRLKPSIYLPVIMIIWGALTCCMAVIDDFKHLVVLRIFVGVFESGFAPGIILIISSWYKKDEQSKRFGVYMSAAILSGAFGGLLAGAITGGMEGTAGLRGWRWLFIVEGAATIRAIAIARLREGGVRTHVEGEERMGKAKSFRLAIMDWRTISFILGYMVIVGSSTLSYFYPTLMTGLGYTDTVTAQYMTVPIYAVAFVCTAVTTYFADAISHHRGLVIASWLGFSLITSILVCVIYDFTARYALLVLMAAGLWASNAVSLSFASATFGSMQPEVRAIAIALVNAMGNLAQIYGAYLFPGDDKPKYLMGFGVISDRSISTMGLFNFLRDDTPPPLYQHGKLGEPGCHLSTVRPRNPDPTARESSNYSSNRKGLFKAEMFPMTSSLQAPNRRNPTGNTSGFGSVVVGPQRGEEAMQELLGQMNERRSGHRSGASGNFPGPENRGINPGFFGQPNPRRTGRSRDSFMQGPMGMDRGGGGGGGGGARLDGVGNSHPAWNMDHVNGSAGTGSQRGRGPTGGPGGMGGFEAMGV